MDIIPLQLQKKAGPIMKKTRQDVDQLKETWLGDPCWDIENTEGFEAYRDELIAYRNECEAVWDRTEKNRQKAKMDLLGIPGNTFFLAYLETLEYQIAELQKQLAKLQGD
jgi:hypothetical protein